MPHPASLCSRRHAPHAVVPRLACALLAALWTAAAFAAPVYAQDDDDEDEEEEESVWSEYSLRGVNTLTMQYRPDNANGQPLDDDYAVAINRLNLLPTWGDLRGNFRIDTFGFWSPPERESGGPSPFQNTARIERATVDYSLGDWTLTAGDVYLQLGRGIMLYLRKESEVAVDTSLRGGQVAWQGDDHTAILFGGQVNPANLDPVSQFFIEDTKDTLVGGSYEYSGLDLATLGGYGLYMEPTEPILEGELDFTRGGGAYADVYGLADWLALYMEGNFQERALAGVGERAWAGYGTANVFVGDTTFLLEGTKLSGFEMRGSPNTALNNRFLYNRAPTLERIDQEVLNTRDVHGGRLRVDHLFPDLDLQIYGNVMLRFTDPGEPNEVEQLHTFGGTQFKYDDGSGRLNLSGGWRDETLLDGSRLKSMIHFETDWLQPLWPRYALHIASLTELRTLASDEPDTPDQEYNRGSIFAGLEIADMGSFTFEYGFDNQDPSPEVAKHFLAGIVAYSIDEDLDLRATAGTQRGGLKCVAGVCRIFPAFAGTDISLIGRF